jgi:uncharacterized protein YjaG (DUF416 family)
MNNNIDSSSLVGFDKNKQLAFAYLAALRAMPTLISFCRKYQFGDEHVFEGTSVILRECIFNLSAYTYDDLIAQLERVDSGAPATNDFPNYDGTVAQDCGGVFYSGLQFLTERNNSEYLEDISTFLTDAVDAYVVAKDNLDQGDPDFDVKISSNPAMVGEVDIQNRIIDYLKTIRSITPVELNNLIEMQKPSVLDLIFS